MFDQVYTFFRRRGVNFYYASLYPLVLKHRARIIGKKDRIEVVFFVFNLAMWRYQGVYDLLSRDKHFNCHIVLTVPSTFTKEQQMTDLNQMRKYFSSRNIQFVDYDIEEPDGFNVKERINPDILFYPQPYGYIYPSNHEYLIFRDKLLCYIPYFVYIFEGESQLYDLHFHNLAWKVFCPFQRDKERAKIAARNHGKNWVVTGYYMLDQYVNHDVVDVWKIKDRDVRRLIWAPHFTMSKVSWVTPHSNFLWMSQLMLNVAKMYKGRLQIAFKPHPRLKSELYRHPDWGKERTDNYFQQWDSLSNTQLETGNFVELFKTSDAMIHDSGSFTVEYLFVNKPVAYVSNDVENLRSDYSDFGNCALDQHYIVGNEKDVIDFINDVVLESNDPKATQRTDFFNSVLKPNVSGETSKIIVDDIKKSLRIV